MRTVVFLALLGAALLPAAGASAASAADKAAARRISQHLKQSGELRNYRIGVTFEDGVASLAGTVASAEQRATAVRLAEQVSGVSHVVCRLQYPSEPGASETGDAKLGERRSLSSAFSGTKPASAEAQAGEPSPVVNAYQENVFAERAPRQRESMLSRTTSLSRIQPAPRSNMPLPRPLPGRGPAIQQASAQGVYQAGGACPPGYGGGPMGGPAMAGGGMGMQAMPAGYVPHAHGRGPSYEGAHMPGYAWPSYASYPNYAALTYPRQYSPTAWPYIGPFYPYPQVPLAWRKVSLEWDDGWWFLDFSAHNSSH